MGTTDRASKRGFCSVCGGQTAGTQRLCPEHKEMLPAEQLRVHLEAARKGGVSFERAWEAAWKRVVWPHDTPTRREWKDILETDREAWASAYDRRARPRPRREAIVSDPVPAVA